MPPKKNGFMCFTFEWKEKYGKNMSIGQATKEAGKIWADMSPQQRGPYNSKAKDQRLSSNNVEKLACTGIPVSYIEKEKLENQQSERLMKNAVDKIIRESLRKNEVSKKKFYFVMANYFTKTLQGGVYIPAEISLSEFTLENGLTNKFHSFINPGINIYGHTYEAQNHSDTTHQLPLPPNALGEKNLGKLYNSILHFIRPNDDGEYPPLFTHRDSLPIVQSAINFLKSDPGSNIVNLKIYSIQYLFFTLKEATCELGEVEKPSSIFVTDAYFERDIFEYMIGIACAYHEERDKTNYCPLSFVTRWCYMFADYMSPDLAIKPIPGRHLPASTKLDTTAHSIAFSDTESFISKVSESTYVSNPLSEHKMYYDDHTSKTCSRREMFNRDDFPDLSGPSRKKTNYQPQKEYNSYLDDGPEVNPWAERSRRIPPQPDESHFNIDVMESTHMLSDLNETDDGSSNASFGRGRLFKGSFGRGTSFSK